MKLVSLQAATLSVHQPPASAEHSKSHHSHSAPEHQVSHLMHLARLILSLPSEVVLHALKHRFESMTAMQVTSEQLHDQQLVQKTYSHLQLLFQAMQGLHAALKSMSQLVIALATTSKALNSMLQLAMALVSTAEPPVWVL